MRRSMAIGVTAALVLTGIAVAVAAGRPAPTPGASLPGMYRNPLSLNLPDGKQAENCADPDVTRGIDGDDHWYLYCTSDAIDADEVDASGGPVQHLLPTYRSMDLVHWSYTGDVFTALPAWVDHDAGLWAPEIQHRNGRWLLYFTASDTTVPGGGSAIGVATSASPTGPWSDSGRPVVLPADDPTSPGDRRWTYDPDVVTVGTSSYLYFGSYVGGVFVRRLSEDGLSTDASSERRIAIANRYEGADLVRHGGWYYFLGSSTNCCAGALTGYSVFAARSRSPLGPFLDADGRSILDSSVGGTPVLSQNGNRWVGAGHDSVLSDASGQDWIVYHAIDARHPEVADTTDYTKRVAMLDRLEWVSGWPVVRGSAGPSDDLQRGPAAQPGQRDPAPPAAPADLRPGSAITALSDDFQGSTIGKRWTWVRPPGASTVSTAHGALRWATQDADIHPPTLPLASVLTEPVPGGDYVVEVKLRTTVPARGDSFDFTQGGVLVYGGDGHYVKLTVTSMFETRQTEFGLEDTAQPSDSATYGNGVVGPVGSDWTWLRISKHEVEGHPAYTASTSVDGRHWRTGVTWAADLGRDPRIGLVSMGGAGFTTVIDSVHVSRLSTP